MKKGSRKVSHRTRQKQKFMLKIFSVVTVVALVAIVKFTAVFNSPASAETNKKENSRPEKLSSSSERKSESINKKFSGSNE
jgi:hypothetical protein